MSISMEIDWAWGMVEFRVSGRLTPMVIVDAFALLNAGPQVAKLRGIIWDVREASLVDLEADGISAALTASPFPGNAIDDFRIAAVTEDVDGPDVAATWIRIGRSLDDADRKLFKCVDEARAWVRNAAESVVANSVHATCG